MTPKEFQDRWGFTAEKIVNLLQMRHSTGQKRFLSRSASSYQAPTSIECELLDRINHSLEQIEQWYLTHDHDPPEERFYRGDIQLYKGFRDPSKKPSKKG